MPKAPVRFVGLSQLDNRRLVGNDKPSSLFVDVRHRSKQVHHVVVPRGRVVRHVRDVGSAAVETKRWTSFQAQTAARFSKCVARRRWVRLPGGSLRRKVNRDRLDGGGAGRSRIKCRE